MKEKLVSLVQQHLDAWTEEDTSKLIFAEDLKHISKTGNFTSRKEFMDCCWGKFKTPKIEIQNAVVEGNQVCVWYEAGGTMVCEWVRFNENQEIDEIRAFF